MAHYRLTRKADNDLVALYEYGIDAFGLIRAQDYLIGLHDCFELLAENPVLGRSAEELLPELKRFEHGSHVVFYLPDEFGILVIRVLRQESDFKRHLPCLT